MPGAQPSSPSHRNPLALLSKLKRQLSKSPSPHHRRRHSHNRRRQQPIEHQYLPIPTVSFSESLHSQSAYSSSNKSSEASSFVFIDHNEEPGSFGVDEYRPFLPLIIQHERLQQRLAVTAATATAATAPPLLQRRRRLPLPDEPSSPTSTVSSRSPLTPILAYSFFDDGDEILSGSEVGSISEYSLPRSLSPYMGSRRGRKSCCQASLSNSESDIRTPPPRPTQQRLRHRQSSKLFPSPPISPPPSRPLPEPPVSVRLRINTVARDDTTAAIRPDSPVFTIEASCVASTSSQILDQSKKGPAPAPVLSPAISLYTQTQTSILSDLDISTSTSVSASASTLTSYHDLSTEDEHQEERVVDDDFAPCVSVSTPPAPTPKQYGMGRQVIRGSGCDFQCDLGDLRNSTRDLVGMRRSSAPALASNAQDGQYCAQVKQDPIPLLPRYVKSDDTNSTDASDGFRRMHHKKPRERVNPEWTLFLGIPRNAPPPVPAVLPVNPGLASSLDAKPHAAVALTASPHPAMERSSNERQKSQKPTFLPNLPSMTTTTTRNRTKSDSALLASAAAGTSGGTQTNAHDGGKTKTKGMGEEDWTLSLPLVVPRSWSGKRGRGSKYFEASSIVSGSVRAVAAREENLVITVEDVDCQQQQHRGVRRSGTDDNEISENDEEEEDPLTLRVPRIVRSCPSSLISTSTSQIKGSARWTSTPNLLARGAGSIERLSSSTLEEEVMLMLLGNAGTDVSFSDSSDEGNNNSKSKSKSKEHLTTLAQKKLATLDEDLTRFNALLRSGSRPSSTAIETAVMMKTKTVTPSSNPTPTSFSTPPKPITHLQTLPIKPVLKHAKTCEPFLECHSSSAAGPPPVMRFPGSGDLNFFDALGDADGFSKPTTTATATLRLTRSAEWRMGASNRLSTTASASFPSSSSTPSLASPPPPLQRTSSSSSNSQTFLLPFASIPSSPSTFNSKAMSGSFTSSGSLRVRVESDGGTGNGVPMPSMTSSIRTASMGSLRSSTVPVESGLEITTSHKSLEETKRQGTRTHLPRLQTSSLSSSSESYSQHYISHNGRSHSPPPPPSPIPSESDCSSSALPTPLASTFPLPPSSGFDGAVVAFQQKLREFENAREKQEEEQRRVVNRHQQERNEYRFYRPSTASSVASLVSNASSTATVVPSGDQKMRIRASESRDGGGIALVSIDDDNESADQVDAESLTGMQEQHVLLEDDEDSMYSGTYYSARSSFSS